MLASAWDAALMLQEFRKQGHASSVLTESRPWRIALLHVKDTLAIYREATSREIEAVTPLRRNGMWVTSLRAADGNKLILRATPTCPRDCPLEIPKQRQHKVSIEDGRWLKLTSRQPLE